MNQNIVLQSRKAENDAQQEMLKYKLLKWQRTKELIKNLISAISLNTLFKALTLRAIFLTTASLKCGSCKKGALPSVDPPVAFLELRGTACIKSRWTDTLVLIWPNNKKFGITSYKGEYKFQITINTHAEKLKLLQKCFRHKDSDYRYEATIVYQCLNRIVYQEVGKQYFPP